MNQANAAQSLEAINSADRLLITFLLSLTGTRAFGLPYRSSKNLFQTRRGNDIATVEPASANAVTFATFVISAFFLCVCVVGCFADIIQTSVIGLWRHLGTSALATAPEDPHKCNALARGRQSKHASFSSC